MKDILNLLAQHKDNIFLETKNKNYTYADLKNEVSSLQQSVFSDPGDFIYVVESENSFQSFAKVLALLDLRKPFIQLSRFYFANANYRQKLMADLNSPLLFLSLDNIQKSFISDGQNFHPLIASSALTGAQLFIVKTSGSSGGDFKYVLHDAGLFFQKYKKIGTHFSKTLSFSPLESIAGIETLLEVVFHGAPLVLAATGFQPQAIAEMLFEKKVDYFQTTPSFLNLLCLSGQFKKNDFTSLKKIAYGSEPMSPQLAETLKKNLPAVELNQTYGMTEIGIQKTTTPIDEAFKFNLISDLNPYKIKDKKLIVKSLTPMLGYLNAEVPEDLVWFNTNDLVEIDEKQNLRVLGRDSDLINVAGHKFFPIEVESLLAELEPIQDVAVVAESNPIIGTAIVAQIFLKPTVDEKSFLIDLKSWSNLNLPAYMRPHRFVFVNTALSNERFKKVRRL